ncbi:hypothetical protein DR64_7675 [Paraburkholderia xenovorans LB400]|uniref:HAMP domain-containing protein n=1 Tax=Paraburkholderia xenovorans TaxID=36873 RepID=UPI00003C4C2B|nr:HAMP domain-containing protein [Paraburkholderia xenovorans]AIP34573.1 hypothetical protein DR64_7675 [Paraburkholderia xenovorans LB400]
MTLGTIGGAMRIAAGDLTVRIDTTREHDIGHLVRAIDGVAHGLWSHSIRVRLRLSSDTKA